MSSDYLNHIYAQVQQQFPAFYQDEGPNFIAFVEAYYEWLESPNNPLYMSRSLLDYGDIDLTPDQFIVYFKEKYLPNIQFNTASNQRLFIKNASDFYRAKGSTQAVELFFQLVYGQDAEVYYPGTDLFKLSDGQWVRPTYLEITNSPLNVSYVGKQVTGVTSGATAFVDRLVRRRVNSKFIDIFYISALVGNMETGELLSIGGSLDNAPAVIGSLTTVQVLAGGQNFVIGDSVDIISNNGAQGTAVVSGIANSTGEVDFTLVNGGFGYTMNAEILISQPTLTVGNIVSIPSISNTQFELFETLVQPLGLISYSNLNGPAFANGGSVFEYNANGVVTGFGTIIEATPSNSTAGQLFVIIDSFAAGNVSNLNSQITLYSSSNTTSATVIAYQDQTATGNLFAESSTANLNIQFLANGYSVGETVQQGNASGVVTNVLTVGANAQLSVANIVGQFYENGANIVGLATGTTGVLQDIIKTIGVYNSSNSFSIADGNYVYGASSLTTANLLAISTGQFAGFKVGSLSNPETATLALDFLNGVNTGNVPFMEILLSGTNSNVVNDGYGFTKDPSGNINTVIYSCLGFEQATVGTIATLSAVNPGENYNLSPFVLVVEPSVAALQLRDFTANIGTTMHGQFVNGELVTQSAVISNIDTLTVTGAGNLQVGEFVYQSNGTANVGTGILQSFILSGGAGSLVVNTVNGSFSTSFGIEGATSGANATVTSVSTQTIQNARALIEGITVDASNNVVLSLKRLSMENVQDYSLLVGATSGATGNVLSTSVNTTSVPVGENAIVDANVSIANGVVATLTITDSGFGYIQGETATFLSTDGLLAGTVEVELGRQGYGTGFYASEGGMLSGDKYLLDSDFYQEYSYEVLSRLPFEQYSSVLKQVAHVAGTRLFGGVVLASNTPVATIPPTVIQFAHGNVSITFSNCTSDATFIVGETVQQGNTFAVVVTPTEADLTFANGAMFELNSNLVQGNTAYGTITAIDSSTVVAPVYGSFVASANVTGQIGQLLQTTKFYELNIQLPFNANVFSGSFIPGEIAYQTNGTANTVAGLVLNANSSVVQFSVSNGTLVLYGQLIGANSTCSANVVLINGSNTNPGTVLNNGDTVTQQTLSLDLVNVQGNNFQVGDVVFQNQRILSVANSIIFSNTATGTVISSNATNIEVINYFGNFSNNALVFSSISNTQATINHIDSVTIAQGTVIGQNTTSVSVYTLLGPWSNTAVIYDANDNIYSLIGGITPISGNAVVNTAINTLTLSNTAAQLTSGVVIQAGEPITGLTSNTTAIVQTTDIEIE
jgi:hypothetical protein